MKAEQIIPHYLALHGKISLQDIGTFTYSGSAVSQDDLSRPVNFEENTISFVYDAKAITEADFIQFIVTHTGKIRSLASSDLESYLITSKQFLNIGKPLLLKDMGYLLKNQSGIFEFKQGVHQHEIIDTNSPGARNRMAAMAQDGNRKSDEVDFSTPAPVKSMSQRKWIAAGLLTVLVIAGVITGIYNFNSNKNKDTFIDDSIQLIDSSAIKDSILKANTPALDTVGFDLIIKYTETEKASVHFLSKMNAKNIPVSVDNTDSIRKIFFIHYELPHQDTTIQRDSLKIKNIPVLDIRLN